MLDDYTQASQAHPIICFLLIIDFHHYAPTIMSLQIILSLGAAFTKACDVLFPTPNFLGGISQPPILPFYFLLSPLAIETFRFLQFDSLCSIVLAW